MVGAAATAAAVAAAATVAAAITTAASAAIAAAVVVTAAISYFVCGSPVVRAVTAPAATAAGAQVPPADDGEGSSYHRLLRAALCHIGKMYFRLTQF